MKSMKNQINEIDSNKKNKPIRQSSIQATEIWDYVKNLENKIEYLKNEIEYLKTKESAAQNLHKKRKNIQSEVSKWLNKLSGNLFFYLVNAKSIFLKLLWALFLIISFSLCFIFLFNTLQQYLEFNFVTNIKVKRLTEINFPSVWFCEIHKTSSIERIFENCTINKKPCYEYFEQINMVSYVEGMNTTCYAFNSKKLNSPKKLAKFDHHGWHNGLILKPLEQNLEIFYFICENSYKPTSYELTMRAINIGQAQDVVLTKMVQNSLGYPYNPCIENNETFDSEFFKETVKSGYIYRQRNCYEICFNSYCKTSCQSTEKYKSCYQNFTEHFDSHKMCSEFCPLECDVVSFSSLSKVYQNISDFNIWIFFNELEYTEITEFPRMTFTDMISNIGGTLGLFLGLSFISFVEIIDLITTIIWIVIKQKNCSL